MKITRKQLSRLILKEANYSEAQQKLIQKLKPIAGKILSLGGDIERIEDKVIKKSLTVLSQSVVDIMTAIIESEKDS